jgi:PAS domain S-box-containing protein
MPDFRSSIHHIPARPEPPQHEGSAPTESDLSIRRVMDTIPGLVWSALPDGSTEFCNQRWLEYTGMSLHEVEGRDWAAAIHPEDRSDLSEKWRAALTQGSSLEAQARMRRADGSFRWFLIQALPLRDAEGRIVRWYGTNTDFEERKQAQEELQRQKRSEERLRESEGRFRALADTAPVMLWMTGTDGLCNYFNKPWLEFTGRTLEQEVGTGWMQGVHPDDVQLCFDGFLPFFHARKPFRMEYRLRRADGEYRWVIESGIPRYTDSGEFAGYIGSNIDITDLKRAQEERERLRQVQEDLAHINRLTTIGELTASWAHEIKQPIAAAVTNARACTRWLQRDAPDIAEACEAASRMVRDAKRAADIVDRVRALYRRGTPQRGLVDVNEIIREMTALLHGAANRHSISIRTELDARLPAIAADRVQLQQVLMNLMLNGIEAMKDTRGELTVTSKRTEDGQLLISVSDLGIGIAPDQADRIFEAFFTTKLQGTGMGLSISRKVIESHGGRLWVTANAGRGATFHFTLPTQTMLATMATTTT